MFLQRLVIGVAAAFAVAGCSNDGGGGFCAADFGGGTTEFTACATCDVENDGAAIDGDSGSAASILIDAPGGETTFRASAPAGTVFPADATPGARMRFPDGNFNNVGVSFRLYSSGVVVGSGGGQLTVNGTLREAGTDAYYSYNNAAAVEFDAVEAVVTLYNNTALEQVRLYEMCGDR